MKERLATELPFTALFAFNDVSALGTIRAFHEAGLRLLEDVSVVGCDDSYDAVFNHPSLTTIQMKTAAETLLQPISNNTDAPLPNFISVEPELNVRESTCLVKAK